jgi:hypothetical protein
MVEKDAAEAARFTKKSMKNPADKKKHLTAGKA